MWQPRGARAGVASPVALARGKNKCKKKSGNPENKMQFVLPGIRTAYLAASFPDLPTKATTLAATEAARVAAILGVPGIAVMDVT